MARQIHRFTKLEDLPEYLTIREAASFVGTSYATMRKHIASGKIPTRELGNRSFVPKEYFTMYEVRFRESENSTQKKPELLLVAKRRDEIEKEKQEQRDREEWEAQKKTQEGEEK